jgi:hypothetical protein
VSAAHPPTSCGCPSVLRHVITCRQVHPELAALPAEMPHNVEVTIAIGPCGPVVMPIINAQGGPAGALLSPNLARGLARMLLLKADEVERNQAEAARAA